MRPLASFATLAALALMALASVAPASSLAQTAPAQPQPDHFEATVVSVLSGDSIAVTDPAGKRHVIRLIAIAAPRPSQPYHANAQKQLGETALNKAVRVVWSKRDERGQLVGRAFVAAANCSSNCPLDRDLGLSQLEAGLAWWLKAERKDQSLSEQGYYEYAEFDARQRRIGLWLDAKPVPPWQWKPKGPGLV